MIGDVDTPDRLLRAVERGLLPSLVEFGFDICAVGSANRGSSVDLVAGARRIDVQADWLEGELSIELLDPDQPPQMLVLLSRLPRDVRASVLEAKLQQAAPTVVTGVLGK
jgi:hypothetical protein